MTEKMPVRHILCATDCAEGSRAALRRAVNLARRFGARLTVLHVSPAQPHEHGPAWARRVVLTADEVETARRDAAKALERFLEAFAAMDFPIDTKTIAGSDSPWREIAQTAADLPADLVVMGSHRRSGLDHLVVGSVAEKVLRHAPCPVLIVAEHDAHDAARPLFHRIVCATDLAPGAGATVDTALALAREDVARVVLLHVVEDVRDVRSLDVYRPVPETAAFHDALAERARAHLLRLGADGRGLSGVTRRVATGRAWEEVVRVAEEEDADLVVIGAHAGGALGRLFLGSTASRVLRHAPCAVLVAHEADAAAPAAAETTTARAAV